MKIFKYVTQFSRRKWAVIALFVMPPLIFFAIPPRDILSQGSCTVVSTENVVLHVFRESKSGSFQEWVSLNEVPSHFVQAVLAAEDKRFYWHPGIDPLALVRALGQNISSLKIVSGASTITQQLVRIVYSDLLPKNRILRKLFEILYSLKIEFYYSKNDIFEAYINLVSFPGNCRGVSMATRVLFNHDVRHLTPDESCALAVFIRRNAMSSDAFVKRYAILYTKMTAEDIISGNIDAKMRAKGMAEVIFANLQKNADKVEKTPVENQFNPGGVAPHFVIYLKEDFPYITGKVLTTLSSNMNRTVHDILKNELESVKKFGASNGAVLVVEIPQNRDKPLMLRAMVGSVDYYSQDSGQVNGALCIRSAGSTLKPFIYALAIDLFNYRPWTLLSDTPMAFETAVDGEVFQPQNYDLRFWGSMTLRDALAASRNIPAVWLVKKIGEEKFYEFLKSAGFSHLHKGPQYHGPGMALGSAGASLLQLVMAYSAFAMKGEMRPLCVGKLSNGNLLLIGSRKRIFSEKAAYFITHILADREARRRAFGKRNFQDFPFEVASKTGTSSDYRDAWIVGYTEKYVVGVWVGDFRGKKMYGVSGGWGAGRVFHQVMRFLADDSHKEFHYPASWKKRSVCRLSGKLAGPHCRSSVELLSDDDRLEEVCSLCPLSFPKNYMPAQVVPIVLSPIDGEVFLLDPHIDSHYQRVPLVIECPAMVASKWLYRINEGVSYPLNASVKRPMELTPGTHTLKLYEGTRLAKTIRFQVVR